jgi:hypothetical protein
MSLTVADRCPNCGLILLWGALLEAAEETAKYGPILGISPDADKSNAVAGYVGLGSLFVPQWCREIYQCPRCRTDTITETPDDDETGRVGR